MSLPFLLEHFLILAMHPIAISTDIRFSRGDFHHQGSLHRGLSSAGGFQFT